ncbi:unnamed protein product [Dimorphilus gyrociliatus]|uniref:Uncharacterized protein n=1 Tax=Dimorphilus gyrociliatus TaxID=2664684 RepID=A0A7I8V653_9ANNE|nr:unnamed protein product [Dimorphilus gyrociliatus]
MHDNQTQVFTSFKLVSSTKDSLLVCWGIRDNVQTFVNAYRLIYTAFKSTIIQKSSRLHSREREFDIQQLHENTYYNICVEAFSSNETYTSCLQASTGTDSLAVALGSSFGAFMALGIIVMFVFLAKWQNTRKLKKLAKINAAYGSADQEELDEPASDISLQALPDVVSSYHDHPPSNSGSNEIRVQADVSVVKQKSIDRDSLTKFVQQQSVDSGGSSSKRLAQIKCRQCSIDSEPSQTSKQMSFDAADDEIPLDRLLRAERTGELGTVLGPSPLRAVPSCNW